MADSVLVPRMTITEGDVFIPEVWAKDLLVARESLLTFAKLVKRYDEDAAEGGDTIHIDNLSNLNVNAKLANTIVTLNAPTETGVTLNLNRHFESSILIEDRLKVQAKRVFNILQQYSERAGYAVAKQMDADIAGLYSSLTQNVGDGSTALGDTGLLAATQKLDEADVPETDRHLVVKPAGRADLLAVDKFTLYHNVNSDQAIRKGAIGDLYGFDVWVTNQIKKETATPNVVHNLLFHRDAFALAIQLQPRVQFQYKQEYLGTLVTADSLWGYAVQRADHAVDVRSAE